MKDVKFVSALFLAGILSCAMWNEAGAESDTTTSQPSVSVNKSQSKITVSNPNQGVAASPRVGSPNYNQAIKYGTRPQYNPAGAGPNRAVSANPFSISAFFSRITSSGNAARSQANIAQKSTTQYNPNRGTSVMDYLRTRIFRIQK